MKLMIIAVGHRMPDWISAGFTEYAQRMPPELRIELREVKPESRSNRRDTAGIMAAERQRIESVLPRNAHLVVLDERGQTWDTQRLAQGLRDWQQAARDVAFVIGGADGTDPALREAADTVLRLSAMTLPHGLVRVLLAEQLYRGSTILQNHPYHRA
ncbi:MAG: 23S rRNA (pseudouridine(1915)-N(3))-methyltransferase RlmH [Janthinobacterium lividum]